MVEAIAQQMTDQTEITPIFYSCTLGPGTWARVHLNDLPLYKRPYVGPDSRSGHISQFILPGENELRIELLKIKEHEQEKIGDADFRNNLIKVLFYQVHNMDAHESEKLQTTDFLDVEFPKIFDEAPEEHQRYPFHYVRKFNVNVAVHTPLFADSPETNFGCEGTPELRDAVQHLYGLLEAGSFDAFMDELSLKFECDTRAWKGIPGAPSAGERAAKMKSELFAFDPIPTEPLDMTQLHFEPRRNGSVAVVSRLDDHPVFDVRCRKDPKRGIRTDLLMLQHQGRWRVFA